MTTLFDTLFKTPPKSETDQLLADSLPKGRAWDKKNIDDSNLRKLIRSVSAAFHEIQNQIEKIATESNVYLTQDLLPEWEKSVGLPDECLQQLQTLQQRREEVILRLRKIPIVTLEEFQALAEEILPGVDVVVIPGHEVEHYTFDYTFPVLFTDPFDVRFLLTVIVPVGTNVTRLNCIFRKISPGNVVIDYIFTPV